jgi:hypothetical protein
MAGQGARPVFSVHPPLSANSPAKREEGVPRRQFRWPALVGLVDREKKKSISPSVLFRGADMNPTNDSFETFFRRQVEEMRLKIDALPHAQQPHLAAMLESMQRQHNELRDQRTQMRAMFDRLLSQENSPAQ